MKGSAIIGILLGALAIFGAFFWENGRFETLFMAPAMLIVFGGTLAAALAGTSFQVFSRIPKLIWLAFFPPNYDVLAIIDQIVKFSYIARREGILGIEQKFHEIEYPFLRKLFQVCVDGADPESFSRIVENEIGFISERHNANIAVFTKMGGFSPTMGIIGTVMGLIATLAAAGSDPNILIHNIASAFIATMWGIFMANIFWLPIADKLRSLHNREMIIYQVMIEGVNSVQLGEVPSVVRSKLISVLPLSQQAEILATKLPTYNQVKDGSFSIATAQNSAEKAPEIKKDNNAQVFKGN